MKQSIRRFIEIQQEDGILSALRTTGRFISKRASSDALRNKIERTRYNITNPSTCIFDEEWETLIVLDACRYDLWEEAVRCYTFPEQIVHNRIHSPASSSAPWMQANFTDEYYDIMAETAYVTANPFSKECINESNFAFLDEVWRYGWDEEIGIVHPEIVTDRAIEIARSGTAGRMIVHYMQPHFPSLRQPELGSKVDPETNRWINSVWNKLKNNKMNHETVWEAYENNLIYVLNSVTTLLTNHTAAKVVITSDHGNGFGEKDIYGHPSNRAHRVLREVPYCVTKAIDSESHMPQTKNEISASTTDKLVKNRLEALGYTQ